MKSHGEVTSEPRADCGGCMEITTLMLRHLPSRISEEEVLDEVDAKGFQGMYDFFYMPREKRQPMNDGW